MKTVAIFGAATGDLSLEQASLAKDLGLLLASRGLVVATGGCIGMPSMVASSAVTAGTGVKAFYPNTSREEVILSRGSHNNDIETDYTESYYYDGFTERSLALIRSADFGIMLYGGIGALSEWSMAVEEGLPMIVIKSGGTTEVIEQVLASAHRVPKPEGHHIVGSLSELLELLPSLV